MTAAARLRVKSWHTSDSVHCAYVGTPDELLVAGVLEPYMLPLPPCGVRSGPDEFGQRYIVQKRAGGRLRVERSTYDDEPRHQGRRYRERLAEAERATAEALSRFRRSAQA